MKTVMLSYLERNKIVKVPETCEGNELEYLEEKFRNIFSYQGNVSICVSFHKFDADWDDYVEVEKGTTIEDKDKLKVIVTPQIITPVRSIDSSVNDDLISTPLTPSGSKELQSRVSSDDCLPIRRRRPRALDYVSDDESVEGSTVTLDSEEAINDVEITVSSKKLKVMKDTDDAIPLPNPFPLPTHYSSEVETALKLGRLSNVTRQAFIARIASLMLNYKKYPSSEDYTNVGQAIIMKYPFLKSPVGSPMVCIYLLLCVFKIFRVLL